MNNVRTKHRAEASGLMDWWIMRSWLNGWLDKWMSGLANRQSREVELMDECTDGLMWSIYPIIQ